MSAVVKFCVILYFKFSDSIFVRLGPHEPARPIARAYLAYNARQHRSIERLYILSEAAAGPSVRVRL